MTLSLSAKTIKSGALLLIVAFSVLPQSELSAQEMMPAEVGTASPLGEQFQAMVEEGEGMDTPTDGAVKTKVCLISRKSQRFFFNGFPAWQRCWVFTCYVWNLTTQPPTKKWLNPWSLCEDPQWGVNPDDDNRADLTPD